MASINGDSSSLNEEKKEESLRDNSPDTPRRLEDVKPPNDALWLSESDALDYLNTHPDNSTPVYVTFSPTDSSNPRNWPKWKRWYLTCFCSMLNVITCLAAGGYSSAADGIAKSLDVSGEAVTVGLSMYILGFAVEKGPMALAPLSEYFGRSITYQVSWFFLFIFQLPLALAPNIGTIIVCRFLAGLGGSAPLTNTGGTISDLWKRNESGNAMMVYGISSTFGPPFALVVSGYAVQQMGWRWLFWIIMIITGGFWILTLVTLPETRHSIILERKAKRVRKALVQNGHSETADRVSDSISKGEKRSLHLLFARNLTRPFRFLFTEPITMGAAAYNGFIYGIVYLFNEAFPLVFGPGPKGHGFNTGEWGLSFLGLCVGVLIAAAFHPLQERYYLKRVAANDGKGVPEARMWQAKYGAFLLPISLFWFAWTSFPSVYWIVPIIASVFFGAGIYIVILGILNYVVDAYQGYSASALAGVILVRNVVGAGFPLFAKQMYEYLGYEWASSLLAFLAILFVPIPIWWFYKGEQLRLRSPFAREHFAQDEDAPH